MPEGAAREAAVLTTPWSGVPSARFDDLTGREGSFRLDGYLGEVVARTVDEVAGAISAAEAAVGEGRWAAGFVSYEAAPGLDPALTVRRPSPSEEMPPLVWFALFERRVPVDPVSPVEAEMVPKSTRPPHPGTRWTLGIDARSYRDQVGRIRSHIRDGDTYQLNLTHRWRSPSAGDPSALYRRLALAQRPRYGALIDAGRWVVASASPELFFEWRDGILTSRPMKGTASRGRWLQEDQSVGASLAASAKDRAENLMIVDLVRSDLGRVADYGTVAAKHLFHLERYPTVWQLTSEVTARARQGTSLVEVFRALFPCGSVTGAPKRRTMELITEVETDCRGVYCGAVGFVGPGEARFNVAIRTVVIDRVSGEARYGSGGGIVWDSDPEREFAEARAKAEILFSPTASFDLIETMAFIPGVGLRNMQRHLDRLARSAEYFGYPFDLDSVAASLGRSTAPLGEPTLVRLSLSHTGRASITAAPLTVATHPGPVRLRIDDQPVDSSDVWLFHKTSRRDTYTDRLARHLVVDDEVVVIDDVVLVNERGQVTETTIASLVVRLEGRWCTPPLEAGCLPGVERGRLLDEGTLVERVITVAELRAAAQVVLVSSVRGWRRAVLVDSCSVAPAGAAPAAAVR